MNDAFVLGFAEENIFLSSAGYDREAKQLQDLHMRRPFVLVCRSHAYAAYLSERFFKRRETRLYVNIEQVETMAIVSVYIHARIEPPEILDQRGRYFLHGVAQDFWLPENNRVQQALYGVTFPTSADRVAEMLAVYQATKHFYATLGIWEVPGEMVLTQEDAAFAQTDVYTSEETDAFLARLVRLPLQLW